MVLEVWLMYLKYSVLALVASAYVAATSTTTVLAFLYHDLQDKRVDHVSSYPPSSSC